MILLQEKNMTVTRASDGAQAVEAFAQNPPGSFDVILMDIMMPQMNGFEATKAIRRMENRPDGACIPIIAMTANAFEEDRKNAFRMGMIGHIAKPIVMDEVITTIARNLNKK